MSDNDKKPGYDSERNGFVLKDGNLIRIQDKGNDGNVRITIYDGDERKPGEHDRTTINYNENTGKGTIDYHNEDKSESSSDDVNCYLTTACMKYYSETFDDHCDELETLRWFRDQFVSHEDIIHYYQIAPTIVENINYTSDSLFIYEYIYKNVILVCVEAIKNGNYVFAYERYKNSVLALEMSFARPVLGKRLVKALKTRVNSLQEEKF